MRAVYAQLITSMTGQKQCPTVALSESTEVCSSSSEKLNFEVWRAGRMKITDCFLTLRTWWLVVPFLEPIREDMRLPCSSNSKESACNAGDLSLIPGSGRSSGEGNGNPLQYSCLENPIDREAWRATVCGVAKGWT